MALLSCETCKDCKEMSCPICLDDFELDTQVLQLDCNIHHMFCLQCFELYIDLKVITRNCPICRTDVTIFNKDNADTPKDDANDDEEIDGGDDSS